MKVAWSSLYPQNLARYQSSIHACCICVALKDGLEGGRHPRPVRKTGEEKGQIGEGVGKGSEASKAWTPLSGSREWAAPSLIPLPPVLWAEATAIIHQSLAA